MKLINSEVLEADIAIRTPLIHSKPLSAITSRRVYLKLENTQPSGSFKLRGISHLCKKKLQSGFTRLIGSSGGNAGLALAYSAEKLNTPCKIFVPNYVAPRMLKKLKSYGVEIVKQGEDLQEANELALEALKNDPNAAYVHPYDDPLIWEGHSNIVQEVQEDLKGEIPACIVLSVGGGGLLVGILNGLESCGWKDVPILAVETVGADCYHQSIKSGRIVQFIPKSIAKTLGARAVAPKLMELHPKFNIISEVLDDKEAVRACIRMADDHGFMVEPACGVSLAAVYSNLLPAALDDNGYDSRSGPIVIIVCGGSDMSQDILNDFRDHFQI